MNKKEAREFLKTLAGNIWSAFAELTLAELRDVREVAMNYSTTNCWYNEFTMKDAFLKMIDDRISDIVSAEKESKRSQL